MTNEGFKGTRLGISKLTIQGTQAHVEANFMDEEGIVHGGTFHKISLGDHEHLRETAQTFLDAITSHITSIHLDRKSVV